MKNGLRKFSVQPALFLIASIVLVACKTMNITNEPAYFQQLKHYKENFSNLDSLQRHWSPAYQNADTIRHQLKKNKLRLTTKAGSEERVKLRFNKSSLSFGSYTWRVYVPTMVLYEKCSIGAFLYYDDKRELDFEIGSGKAELRDRLGAQTNELLLYCTSQRKPESSKVIKIKPEAWYTLRLVLTPGKKDKFFAEWFVNGKRVHQKQLKYKNNIQFRAFCSLENIPFIGDKATTVDNYTLFDWFEYVGE